MTQRKPPADETPLDPAIMDQFLQNLTPLAPPAGLRAKVLERIRQPEPDFLTLRVDTGWESVAPALEIKLLTYDTRSGTKSFLVRAQAGACMPAHHHHGYEECLVLEGEITLGDMVLRAGDFHGAQSHTQHPSICSDRGALVYVRSALNDYPDIHP